ncbi:MAG: hypothetical protein KA371_03635 [Acidobacteria bacterium]|nr:hypothetical protein [Acidobacteriota bacterium]
MRARRSLLPAVVAPALALALASPRAQPADTLNRSWRQLTTDAFTVVAEGNDGRVREIAEKVDAFRAAVHEVFPAARLEPLVPTTVVVFSPAGFNSFKPLSGGRRQDWVGGYALSAGDATLLVMGYGGHPASTYGLVFHEYMHEILARTFPVMPHWYNEGVAELFGAFAGTASDGRAVIGRPIQHRLDSVRADGLLPLRDMLNSASAAKWQRELPSRFYASAWLMAHYFLMDPERRRGLLSLLTELTTGADVDSAVQKTFGMTVDGMTASLTNYARRSTLPVLLPPAPPVSDRASTVLRMTDRQVANLHADLLLRIGDVDGADDLLKKAVARFPDDDGLRTAVARLRLAQDRAPDALTVLATASEPRSVDSLRAEADALRQSGRLPDAADRLARAATSRTPSPLLLFELGRVHMAQANWAEATAAFTRLRVLDARAGWDLSRAYEAFRLGYGVYTASAARAYLAKVGWSEPSSPYAAFAGVLGLWRDKRQDEATALLADVTKATTGAKWPAPIVAFLNGRLPAPGLIDAATSDGERTEAHAYVGLVASIDGRRDDAIEHLTWVKTRGERQYVEYGWATAELERLVTKPPVP